MAIMRKTSKKANCKKDSNNTLTTCGHCSEACEDSDDAICCDECHIWYHAVCADLDSDELNALEQGNWYCVVCTPKLAGSNPLKMSFLRATCKSCSGPVENDNFITCLHCAEHFHKKCTKMKAEAYNAVKKNNLDWICIVCKDLTQSGNSQIPQKKSPLKSQTSSSFNDPTSQILQSLAELRTLVSTQSEKQNQFLEELKKNKIEQEEMKNDITILKEDHTKLNRKMENELLELKIKMNRLEQSKLLNTLEITGIPHISDENLTNMVISIARLTGYTTVTENDISQVYRYSKKGEPGKISDCIIATFKGSEIPQKIHQLKKNMENVLTLKDAGLLDSEGYDEKRKIFINEHLTPMNRHLFWLARQTKVLGYKYCWTRNGTVLLKQSDTSKTLIIQSPADIPVDVPGKHPLQTTRAPEEQSTSNNANHSFLKNTNTRTRIFNRK